MSGGFHVHHDQIRQTRCFKHPADRSRCVTAAADIRYSEMQAFIIDGHRPVTHGIALRVVATMIAQVAWVLMAYRARLETFVIQPGRFERAQVLLGSDVFVFLVPLGLAMVALAALLSRQMASRRSVIYANAVAVATATELLAVFVAFNVWGT
jgi:hypothetical protein